MKESRLWKRSYAIIFLVGAFHTYRSNAPELWGRCGDMAIRPQSDAYGLLWSGRG